jgi:hypothetical protein
VFNAGRIRVGDFLDGVYKRIIFECQRAEEHLEEKLEEMEARLAMGADYYVRSTYYESRRRIYERRLLSKLGLKEKSRILRKIEREPYYGYEIKIRRGILTVLSLNYR